MNNILKYITLGAIVIVCQILVSEYVNIWAVLYIAVFPQFVILLPPTINRSVYLLIAFALGLSIDLFADGVLGLNAAALTAMAYIRPAILKFTVPKTSFESYDNQPLIPRTVELPKLALLDTLLLAVFFTVYVLLDSAVSFSAGYTLLKIVLCVAANSAITFACNIVLLDKILR